MDLLLAANITVAVMLLLSTVYVKTPLELSVFPSLLLGTTLARLALNVATTRLILTQGAVDGDSAAGGVIQSFSQFVTGDNLAVGIVIFSIIVVIQFVVITKGATRISEVSARFALDGLPGRQMAIDADLNAGLIDSQKAQTLRAEVVEHADFYGAMDGASKFVRGDAIAGVIITVINIAGGLAIGISSSMSIGEAATTFTQLTIGDGLASQVPALLISLAAGLLVTRSSRKTNLPRESVNQVFARPIVLIITAVFLGLMILTDLPKLPLIVISLGCLGAAYSISRNKKQTAAKITGSTPATAATRATEATIDKLLSNDILEMELGVGLIKLADSRQGGQLLAGVTQVRKEIAAELGLILPKTRIRDNLEIGPNEFRIRIQGNIVQRGEIQPDNSLAIDDGRATGPLGEGTVRGFADEQLSSSPAYWIDASAAQESKELGYHVLDATEVLSTLLKTISIENASYLLTRDATKQLVDEIAKSSPALVSELIPDVMSLAKVQQVLKGLVSDRISIRPLTLILESLSDHASEISNRWDLTEKVRIQLSRHIVSNLTQESGNSIEVFTISPEIEQQIATAWHRDNDEIRINLPREIIESLANAIQTTAQKMRDSGIKPIALVDQSIRPVIAELAFDNASDMFVLGRQEAMGAEIDIIGEISADELYAVAQAA